MARKYGNPPIIEAICEFRFDPASPWDLVIPGLLYERLKSSHPKRRQMKAIEVTISAQKEKVAEQTIQTSDRVQFLAQNEKDIVQVGPQLLAVNRLEPYSSWDEFLPAIKKAFAAYLEIADPKALARLGLRYINKIVIPEGTIQMENYFDFYAYLGQELPQTHGAFRVGVQFPFEDGRDTLRVEMQNIPSPSPSIHSMLLDLDYFTLVERDLESQRVFDWLNRAHGRVEEVFEGCLKEPSRQLFNPITLGS